MVFRRQFIRRRSARFRTGNKKWLFLFVILMAILFSCIYLFEQTLEPMLIAIARTELKKAAQEAVSTGVKEIASTQDIEQLMQIEKDKNGKITLVKIDSKVQAELYSQITKGVQKELKKLNDHRMELSLGQLLQSPILSDYGPKIPVQLWPKGSSKVSLVPKMQSAGINTVMVSLNLQVHSELSVIVPFSKETTVVDISYPMGEMMMVGEVPEYYFYNNGSEMKTMPTLPVPAKE